MAGFPTPRLEASRPPRPGRDPALPLRIASALVLAPVAIAIAIYGGWALAGFVVFFAVAMSYEWLAMSDREAPHAAYSIFAAGVCGAAALAGAEAWIWCLGVIIMASVLMGVERRQRGEVWRAVFGAFYISLPCIALIWVRNGDTGGMGALFYLFSVVWAADIAAYGVGTWIGGPKLLPNASPNKTWSGLLAGLCAGGAGGFAYVTWISKSSDVAFLFGTVSVAVALAAVLGDLLESSLKRHFGVKDTGTLIPGHGGVLDRVDALMAAVLLFAGAMLIWPEFFEPLKLSAS